MAEFNELIKSFDKIRDYMRDFYVYGFKSREQFTQKSSRSYDNERRRVECWLGDVVNFRTSKSGKNVFISVDSGLIDHNPLFAAYKSKSFTKNDITLHFILLDILKNNSNLTVTEITDIISSDYLCYFEYNVVMDCLTVRLKLNEYVKEGLLCAQRCGKKIIYSLVHDEIDISKFNECIMFLSEAAPLGVIGSYILDGFNYKNTIFRFKHHYIMHTLEDTILIDLLSAIHEGRKVQIENHSLRCSELTIIDVLPLKILVSVQSGRRYLCGYDYRFKMFRNYRLDYIKNIKTIENELNANEYKIKLEIILPFSWSTSLSKKNILEKLEMKLHIDEEHELYIANRIKREGRHGTLERVSDNTYLYTIETYDTNEMLPWIRTFIGRIISLECSNKKIADIFYRDFEEMQRMYE